MRSFLYPLLPLTTIVAALSLATLDGGEFDGDGVQSIIEFPTGNSKGPLDGPALGLDNTIPGWGEVIIGTEQAQANIDVCPGSKRDRKRRRGATDYCSPAATPPLQFRPHSQQQGSEPSSEQKKTEGSITTNQPGSSKSGPQPSTDRRLNILVPWSTTQSVCAGSRQVAICAGADFQRLEINQEWQQIPFSEPPPPSSSQLFNWPFCRLCVLYTSI